MLWPVRARKWPQPWLCALDASGWLWVTSQSPLPSPAFCPACQTASLPPPPAWQSHCQSCRRAADAPHTATDGTSRRNRHLDTHCPKRRISYRTSSKVSVHLPAPPSSPVPLQGHNGIIREVRSFAQQGEILALVIVPVKLVGAAYISPKIAPNIKYPPYLWCFVFLTKGYHKPEGKRSTGRRQITHPAVPDSIGTKGC